MANNPSLSLTIQNREKIVFQGTVNAVSSYNEKGIFDILPKHTNFITLIKDHIVIHTTDGTDQTINCKEGVLWVNENVVRIIIDILVT